LRRFSTFWLDAANQCIWLENQSVSLQPKAFAVLAYLSENSGRIVTKEELLEKVWPNVFVQEAVLKTCILSLRKALDDDPKKPRCIETVHRRGYRFIDKPLEARGVESSPSASPSMPLGLSRLLGRESDLKTLHTLFAKVGEGERQVVFITGEPGIGKSTLINHFLDSASQVTPTRILRGQCIEHFGAREAYYPVFDALARSARDAWIPHFVEVLRTHAPTWLVELPALASAQDRASLKQETVGATRDRMLREMTEAIETLAADTVVALVLEDLHWSDVSTLDLISSIANRSTRARLMIIGSYRPVEVALADHPVKAVKQGLRARGLCSELQLELLCRQDVGDFLNLRFSSNRFPGEFADLVHGHTEGNPLYLTNILDYAVSRSVVVQREGVWELSSAPGDFDLHAPESLTQIIERQIERLSPEEQTALEVASVIGVTFAIPLMGGIGGVEKESVEMSCDGLAKRNLFVRTAGISQLPSGDICARYQFMHALYREVFYKRLPPARKIRLHRTIGEWLESLYQARLSEVASELALHFQECHDFERAVRYLLLVAQRCASRHALREALEALTRGMNVAARLPEPIRLAAELALREEIGLVYRLMGQLVSSAAEFNQMFEQARHAGSAEGQLRALLWFASVSSWLNRTGCLAAIDKVRDLCTGQIDSRLRVNALGQVSYFNLLFRGWEEADFTASASALESARHGSDRPALALQCNRHSFFECLSSQYRKASRTAAEESGLQSKSKA
jgi:DNA-binding winged helix-turn-helix (wHTH) protein